MLNLSTQNLVFVKMLILSAQNLVSVKMLILDNLEHFLNKNPHQIPCLYQGRSSTDPSCEWVNPVWSLLTLWFWFTF